MKKRGILIILFVTGLIFLTAFSSAFFTPATTFSCVNDGISTLFWSVFEGEGAVTYFSNSSVIEGVCSQFFAYKISGDVAYVLEGKSPGNYTNTTTIVAVKGNFSDDFLNKLRNMTSISNASSIDLTDSSYARTRNSNVVSVESAHSEFDGVFKADSYDWTFSTDYIFSNQETSSGKQRILSGIVNKDKNYTRLNYQEVRLVQMCNSNWTAVSTSCMAGETLTIWYNDTSSCQSPNNRPSNVTRDCDYDSNGVIGNFSSFAQNNIAINVYLDSVLGNISVKYNTSRLIEFKEDNIMRVSFNYNFGSPLNLKIVTISKQPSSSSYGYMIVNGINISKTVVVDKLAGNSSKVCIRNSESTLGEVSAMCNQTNEFVVDCPGSLGQFSCNITDNMFVVSGLTSSLVKEVTWGDSSVNNCKQNWSCVSWGNCISGNRSRTCNDVSNCNNLTGMPAIIEACARSCIANWTCTSWNEGKCSSDGIKTRVCRDTKNCNNSTGKPSESGTCEKSSGWMIISIIIAVVVILIAVVVYFLMKSRRSGFGEVNIQGLPRTPPGGFPNTYAQPKAGVIISPERPVVPSKPMPIPPVRPSPTPSLPAQQPSQPQPSQPFQPSQPSQNPEQKPKIDFEF